MQKCILTSWDWHSELSDILMIQKCSYFYVLLGWHKSRLPYENNKWLWVKGERATSPTQHNIYFNCIQKHVNVVHFYLLLNKRRKSFLKKPISQQLLMLIISVPNDDSIISPKYTQSSNFKIVLEQYQGHICYLLHQVLRFIHFSRVWVP